MNESLNYASSANLTSTFNLSDINSEFVDFTGIILNKSPGYIKQDSGFIVVTKLIILTAIMIVGITCNVIIIYSIGSKPQFHGPPFYYLISLSVSDLSRTIFCFPFVLSSIIEGSVWKHGESSCTLLAFANTFFVFSSVVALFAIAVDRHLAIVHTQFHKRRSRGFMNLAIVVVGWLVSFAVSFPPVFGMGTYKYIQEESQCTFRHHTYRGNDTLGFLLVMVGVMFGTFILYIKIFIFLRNHRRMCPLQRHIPARSNNWAFVGAGANGHLVMNWINGFTNGMNQIPTIPQNLARIASRIRLPRPVKNEHLTKKFFIMTILFDILWIPYLVKAFVSTLNGSKVSHAVGTILSWITYTQVALCPLIYLFLMKMQGKPKKTVASENSIYQIDSRRL
jgi:hypothetical protein